ncbi:MAG: OsmC family protein [Spirochaetota bacterium]
MEVRSKNYTYRTSVAWSGEKRGVVACEGKPDLAVATPPEFKGHPGIWSPEDLFVTAVNSCVMTTFIAMAERASLVFTNYRSEVEGTLEKGEAGFSFTRVVVRPRIGIGKAEDREKVLELIEKAEHACLISNSIKATVTIEPEIEIVVV